MMGTARKLENLPGAVPVSYSPGLYGPASEVRDLLSAGCAHLEDVFQTETPRLRAMLLTEDDWIEAPRESERPYPYGLPYFTRSSSVPTLVLPKTLSATIQPRTELTLLLMVWHELSHAFLLQRETVRVPLWLGEFVPQTAAAAVALREGLKLDEHLAQIEEPEFAVREFELPASARDQMRFQNVLLSLGAAAISEFGDEFLTSLIHDLWNEKEVVDDARAEEMLVSSLGGDAREWLESRPEFRRAS